MAIGKMMNTPLKSTSHRIKLSHLFNEITQQLDQVKAIFVFDPQNGLTLITHLAETSPQIDMQYVANFLTRFDIPRYNKRFGDLVSISFGYLNTVIMIYHLDNGLKNRISLGFICTHSLELSQVQDYLPAIKAELTAIFGLQ